MCLLESKRQARLLYWLDGGGSLLFLCHAVVTWMAYFKWIAAPWIPSLLFYYRHALWLQGKLASVSQWRKDGLVAMHAKQPRLSNIPEFVDNKWTAWIESVGLWDFLNLKRRMTTMFSKRGEEPWHRRQGLGPTVFGAWRLHSSSFGNGNVCASLSHLTIVLYLWMEMRWKEE